MLYLSASRPVSSFNSLLAQTSGSSPLSSFPAGNSSSSFQQAFCIALPYKFIIVIYGYDDRCSRVQNYITGGFFPLEAKHWRIPRLLCSAVNMLFWHGFFLHSSLKRLLLKLFFAVFFDLICGQLVAPVIVFIVTVAFYFNPPDFVNIAQPVKFLPQFPYFSPLLCWKSSSRFSSTFQPSFAKSRLQIGTVTVKVHFTRFL